MADHDAPSPAASAAAALIQVIAARYPGRLSDEQLREVQHQIASLSEAARVIRAYPVSNADEPATIFLPIREG